MIQIGNQTAFSAASPMEPFEYAVANGFDAFEWFPDKKPTGAGWDESDLDESLRSKIRETSLTRGMRLSVHARWGANPLQPDSYPMLQKDLELAKALGAALLNIHLYSEAGLGAYVEAIAPLVRRVAEAGLQLSIENTPEHTPEDFNELFARLHGLDTVSTHHVGMCLDLAHANLCAATRNNYLQFLDRLSLQAPIIHLHLHENWGDADSHLPLFTGPAGQDDSGIRGLLERLRRRNYSGSIILEQWPQPPSLLNHARNKLLGLLSETAEAERRSFDGPPNRGLVDEAVCGARGLGKLSATPRLGADVFAQQLVEANQRYRSWREKLDFVCGLLARENSPLSPEQLVDVAIYLRFLSTGEIPCVEDGRHFRPAHHASIALQIQERLAELTTPENACIVRKIYPCLPSSARTFQRAEPLTRIRDIAHRNDIPSELKREIKQTLQNKLHRCAGPEDLATSARLMERITAPGANYPSAFVEQFKIFNQELTEFFNARSLEELLKALLPAVGGEEATLIRRFLEEKKKSGLPAQLATFRLLTDLRHILLDTIDKNPSSETQERLLADIGLEVFAFVLLSEIINAFAAAKAVASWENWLETLHLTVTNLALSSVEPAECRAIGAELRAWRESFDPVDREHLLRLKATTERSRRLAENYSDRMLALFPERVEKLGRALGVAEHAIRVFCDAEIRAHIIFQLSKVVSHLLRRTRQELGLAAWDVVVVGRAQGRLRAAAVLGELGEDLAEPLVVLLKNAQGDEEIPQDVAGIVLAHEIPHLSHLGVRARQAKVVLVASEEATNFAELQTLEGQTILLTATPEKVEWETTREIAPAQNRDQFKPAQVPKVRLKGERPWISLEQIIPENAGGKAAGARRLAELAGLYGAGFNTPPALAAPFGLMESALHAAPDVEGEYRELLSRINGMTPGDFASATDRLRDLIQQLRVPDEIASELVKRFNPNGRLIVRSSTNCEDLAELAGAGLYESVGNVAPSDIARAVREVWSSLWTRRAAFSRKRAGIPHEEAHMAVLIQQMLTPDFSFILHTVNPINNNPREAYAEIAVGLGETLASAVIRGNPYRMVCDKESGAATLLAFANFSQAIWPNPVGGLIRKTVDYSMIELSRNCDACKALGRRLAAIARFVENALRKPKDIEGAILGKEIYLVQARPQQGVTS